MQLNTFIIYKYLLHISKQKSVSYFYLRQFMQLLLQNIVEFDFTQPFTCNQQNIWSFPIAFKGW